MHEKGLFCLVQSKLQTKYGYAYVVFALMAFIYVAACYFRNRWFSALHGKLYPVYGDMQ